MTDDRLLVPSSRLHGELASGALAVLASGALSVIGGVAQIVEGQKPGFTLAQGFGWASLVPLVAVLRTYQALAREADADGLRRSAQCLFGVVVLFHVFELASLNVFPVPAQIAIWVVFALGMLALMSAPFVSAAEWSALSGKDKPEGGRSRAGALGGIGLGLLVLFKLAGKGFLGKWIAFRMIGRLFANPQAGEVVGYIALLLLMLVFTLWFAVAKVRLRDRLGGTAVLVSVAEVLLLFAVGGAVLWCMVDVETAADRKAREAQWTVALAVVGMASDTLWSGLTAYLFYSLRGRYDPDREWLEEFEPALADAESENPE